MPRKDISPGMTTEQRRGVVLEVGNNLKPLYDEWAGFCEALHNGLQSRGIAFANQWSAYGAYTKAKRGGRTKDLSARIDAIEARIVRLESAIS